MCPKVICLVPSLTETLIECGVEVVGRTQFCIHPQEKVTNIPVVGGTKRAFWSRTEGLGADFVIMDREENTLEMAKQAPLPLLDTHIVSLETAAEEFKKLSEFLMNSKLLEISERYRKIASMPPKKLNLDALPGVQMWINKPSNDVEKIIYIIWRNPWMRVHRGCYIGSVLAQFGVELEALGHYPEVPESELVSPHNLVLFSSEPYLFGKELDGLKSLGNSAKALVDGESISWFGKRSLEFLEKSVQP